MPKKWELMQAKNYSKKAVTYLRRKILITRPVEDALATADLLRARGFDPIIEPMLIICQRAEVEPPYTDHQSLTAIIATSANGIRALAGATKQRDIQIITVGDASSTEATKLGFKQVQSAGGNVKTLEKYLVARFCPDSKFLYVTGKHLSGTLQENLLQKGFDVERLMLYQTQQAEKFSAELKEMLKHS